MTSSDTSPELSLVFPAHNEQDNIPHTLLRAEETVDRLRLSAEIIVVDDGSTDDTAAAVRRFPRVRLIQHPKNRGYGAALRTGFEAARGQRVFFTDADLQFDLAELEGLLAASEGADLVIGYRAGRKDPLNRRLAAAAWGGLVRTLCGLRVRDVNCAFKLIDRRVIEAVTLSSEGALINTELLVGAQAQGFVLAEVPVRHYPREAGRQSGNRPDVVARALLELTGWVFRGR
ncbi:MAG: glycosyltransferase involved in cell wall biosynthesis [Myxococcota bacterium]|jgi:glycosyltransferase involved in cell wall biosynthesis